MDAGVPSPEQWEMLIEHVKNDPEMLTGVYNKPMGKARVARKWDTLAILVNNVPGATKSGEKWKEAWAGLKSRTRHRSRNHFPLSPIQMHVLEVVGPGPEAHPPALALPPQGPQQEAAAGAVAAPPGVPDREPLAEAQLAPQLQAEAHAPALALPPPGALAAPPGVLDREPPAEGQLTPQLQAEAQVAPVREGPGDVEVEGLAAGFVSVAPPPDVVCGVVDLGAAAGVDHSIIVEYIDGWSLDDMVRVLSLEDVETEEKQEDEIPIIVLDDTPVDETKLGARRKIFHTPSSGSGLTPARKRVSSGPTPPSFTSDQGDLVQMFKRYLLVSNDNLKARQELSKSFASAGL